MALTKSLNGVTYDVGSPEYNQAFGIDPVSTYGKSPVSRGSMSMQDYIQRRAPGGGTGSLNTSINPTQRSSQQSIADWYTANGMDVNNGGALGGTQSYSPHSAGGALDYANMWNNIKSQPYTGQNPQSAAWGSVSNNFGNPYSYLSGTYGGGSNYGQAGQTGANGFSPFANQQMGGGYNQMMQYLSQLTGYYPTDYLNQNGNQSLNVLQLNSMLNPPAGMGIQNNYGGAGGGLPDYFGNGYGMGIGEYTQNFNQADLQPYLGDLSQYGGIGGSLTERLNKLYNPFQNRSLLDQTADYLEFAAPRYSQGWNLYGMSPGVEGMLAQENPSPHNYSANWAGQGQQGIKPFTLNNLIADAYPRTSSEWEDGGWRDFYPAPTPYSPLDSRTLIG